MMEPVIGSARLFAAFESAGVSPGADLRSAFGPSANPAEAVIRAFEEAMAPPGDISGLMGSENDFIPNAEMTGGFTPAPALAEDMPAPQSESIYRADRVAEFEVPGMGGYADSGLRDMVVPQSPVELYQTQYRLGILRAHVNVVVNSSQNLTQSLESALKQSG